MNDRGGILHTHVGAEALREATATTTQKFASILWLRMPYIGIIHGAVQSPPPEYGNPKIRDSVYRTGGGR